MTRTDNSISCCGSQPLCFDQTIKRHLVHKSSVHDVFITDTRITETGSFLVGAQLPRQHALYSDRIRRAYDPLLIAEACRQATIAMAHRYFEVPLDWPLLAHKMELTISEREALIIGRHPANISILVQKTEEMIDKEKLVKATLNHAVSLGGRAVAHVQGEMKGIPKNIYDHMRRDNKKNKNLYDPFDGVERKELDPSSLGRHDHRNVVINDSFDPEGRTYPAKINRNHAGLFDHEVDHISGTALVEVCRQASFRYFTRNMSAPQKERLPDWEVFRLKIDFTEFAEFGTPVYCRVTTSNSSEGDTAVTVALEVIQGSTRLGQANILWSCK